MQWVSSVRGTFGTRALRRSFHSGKYFGNRVGHHSAAIGLSHKTNHIAYVHTNASVDLFYYTSDDDTAKVQSLLDEGGDVNTKDYDACTPLHIAATEGNLAVCELLVKNGADLNAKNRMGQTPLICALNKGHVHVLEFLRESGGTGATDLTSSMLHASSEGDIATLLVLLQSGADVNQGDYDLRTPLHLAAADGQVQAVEFLLANGANPTVVDRFGFTPLQDAFNGVGRGHRAVAQVLGEVGASLHEQGDKGNYGTSGFNNAVVHTLPVLCDLGNYAWVETFIPSHNELLFNRTTDYFNLKWGLTTKQQAIIQTTKSIANTKGSLVKEVFETQAARYLTRQEFEEELHALDDHFTGAVLMPFSIDDTHKGLMLLYTTKEYSGDKKPLPEMASFIRRALKAGFYGIRKPVQFSSTEVEDSVKQTVWKELIAQSSFDRSTIFDELEKFYAMGIPSYYFNHFEPQVQARHIGAYIASKKFATDVAGPDKIWLHVENNPLFMGRDDPEQAFMMIPNNPNTMKGAEKYLEMAIARIPSNLGFSLEYFVSKEAIPGGTKKLGVYVLETNTYASPYQVDSTHTNIWDIAPEVFHKLKPPKARQRYQNIIDLATDKLCPVSMVEKRKGECSVMLAFSTDVASADRNHNVNLIALTDLIKINKLNLTRKFAQSFANGTIVYSLYFEDPDYEAVERLCDDFKLLYTLPFSQLTRFYLQGKMDSDLYSYGSVAGRFVYYFMNQRSDEYDSLERELADDTLNLSRLRLLHTSLKREAVGIKRVWKTILGHGDLVRALLADFQDRTLHGKAADSTELEHQIHSNAYSPLDEQVLRGLLQFNKAARRTNFYSQEKAAVAFRMDPNVMEGDWPQVPFGIYFLVSTEFQGFHVRFRDISRGGIRIIRSRDPGHYNTNLATLFAENYALAYTQNKKNKDIPEFGSKGTVLLAKRSQGNDFSAFKKYISGLMDLLITKDGEIAKEGVVDQLNREEILFLGPDEGTADMMEWACRYSKERGYPFWKSFTTGKPPSLGGIPHDTYGMTTRSVRQYAQGTMEKLGLDETQVTKFQTGGPDGDLGSNEILLSKDKTTSIVDGSGVLHDPEGLNRDELTRLATKRVMISEFDSAKLGPNGFKVLVTQDGVTLPNGTVVESGLAFRNNFHLNPLSSADFFVPCGGRPESVNVQNVEQLFDDKGVCRFKYVIEGANLFFTNDARMILEERGVYLYKDASTNKGGVTSSSLEVFAALALTDKEFFKLMAAKSDGTTPAFYQEYVQEIQERVEADAYLEFLCIWEEAKKTGTPRFILTESVSDKINELNDFVQASNLWENEAIKLAVMEQVIPKCLTRLLGVELILERVPEAYTKAIFAAYLSSRYVYKYGCNAHEFSFFEFMQNVTKDSK